MIIESKQKQIQLLKECREHILRMYNSQLTHSEKKELKAGNISLIEDPKTLGESSLPQTITYNGHYDNAKKSKLIILTYIYNNVSKNLQQENDSVDLDTAFTELNYCMVLSK